MRRMSNELTRPGTLDEAVRDAMTRWSIPGIAVGIFRDGAVETHGYGVASLETGFPVRPDTLFQIGSISKVYTATLAMQLVEEGKLKWTDRLADLLPDLGLQDARANQVLTLEDILSHKSGIPG